MPAATRIAIPRTEPGATVQLSMEFTAPATPGSCISHWKMVFEDGSLCFPKTQGLSVMVRVSSLATGTFGETEDEDE